MPVVQRTRRGVRGGYDTVRCSIRWDQSRPRPSGSDPRTGAEGDCEGRGEGWGGGWTGDERRGEERRDERRRGWTYACEGRRRIAALLSSNSDTHCMSGVFADRSPAVSTARDSEDFVERGKQG